MANTCSCPAGPVAWVAATTGDSKRTSRVGAPTMVVGAERAGVVQAPKVFRLDARGKAEVLTPVQTWSPVQGAYVLNCPTDAISVRPEETAA